MAPWPIPWLGRLLWRSDPAGSDGDLAAIAESTRRFVTLLKAPPQSTSRRTPPGLVYLLASEALSERSALDAVEVVRAIKPGAVVAQVGYGALAGLRSEEESGKERIPTNTLAVIRACFLDSSQRGSFDSRAGVEVLRSIFGTTYHGPALSAKNAAREARCAFLFLETPSSGKNDPGKNDTGGRIRFGEMMAVAGEIAARVHDASSSFQRQSLCQSLRSGGEIARYHGKFPAYASSFYSFLVDLHDAYRELPGMSTALDDARRLLFDVEQGGPVDQAELAGAQNFRLAVEGLRIALVSAGSGSDSTTRRFRKAPKFEEMTSADQGDVLLAQALQEQARVHGSVVAVVDASSVAGIRRQWNTAVAPDVRDRARECFVVEFDKGDDGDGDENLERKIAGSGGAVAVVGIASLPWWAPATTPFTKVIVLKAPAFVKLGLVQMKRNATLVLAKTVTPLLTPGKAFSAMVKSAASAGKARAAAHSVVASAERATLSAIRTAFYCLMRKKQGMSSGGRPWLVLGGSVVAGAGILWSGDRLESAIEVAPAAPRVARLGRGLENLERASRSLSESHPQRVWEDLYKRIYK